MTRSALFAVFLATLVLAAAACTPAEQASQDGATPTQKPSDVLAVGEDEIQGAFSMIVMAHTTSFAGTEVGQEQQPNPWDGSTDGGPYRYAAIPCNEDAPLNNISGDLPTFNTLVEGSRVPASTRAHPLEFSVSEGEGGTMQIEGTLQLTVCQLRPGVTPDPDPVPDAEKHKIRFDWTAQAEEGTAETIVWRGSFDIVGGTGPYEDLQGGGDLSGYFFCFAPEGCEEIGEYRDVQFVMSGTYEVPSDALDQAQAQPTAAAEDEAAEPTEDTATESSTETGQQESEPATQDATEEPTEPVEPTEATDEPTE